MPNSKDLDKEQTSVDEANDPVPSDDDPSGEFVDATEGGQEETPEVLSCGEEYKDVDSPNDHAKVSNQSGDDEDSNEDESTDEAEGEDENEDDDEEEEEEEDEDETREEKDTEKIKSENESDDGKTAADVDVNKDEDRRNPQYIPKKGTFYEHDDRILAAGEKPEITEEPKPTEKEQEKKVEVAAAKPKKVKPKKSRSDDNRWGHDMFNVDEQKPKAKEEIISAYGYDIRSEDGPPKARRRRKYGRGPKKYSANWKDQETYAGPPQDHRRNRPRPPRPRERRENVHDRLRDERPRDDRGRDERIRDDRGRGDKPRIDRMRDDRIRDDRTRDNRYRDDRVRDDRVRDDRVRDDRLRDERIRDDRIRDDRIRDDRIRDAKPRDSSPRKGQSSTFVKTIVFENSRSFKDRRAPRDDDRDQRRSDDLRRRYRDEKVDLELRMGKLSLERQRVPDKEPTKFNKSGPVGNFVDTRATRDVRDRGVKNYSRESQHPQPSTNNPSTKRYSSLRQQQQQEQKLHQPAQKPSVKEPSSSNDTNQYQPPQIPVNQRPPGSNSHFFPPQSGSSNSNYYPETRSSQSSYNFMAPNGMDQNRFPQIPQRQFMPSTGPPPTIAEPRFMSQPVSATAPAAASRALPQVIPGPPGAAYLPTYPPGYPQFPPPPPAAAAQFNMNPLNPLDMYGGVTYYDTITQQVSPRQLPQRRPKNALPIIPPPGANEVDPDMNQGIETPDQKLKKLLENEGEGHCVSSMENYPLEIGEA